MRISPELETQLGEMARREKRSSTEVARIILEAAVPAALEAGAALTQFADRIGNSITVDRQTAIEKDVYEGRPKRRMKGTS